MTKKLFCEAMLKFTSGVALTMLLLFLPAGSLRYPGGWYLMGVLFLPMLLGGCFLMVKNPVLLQKRLRAKESQGEQKTVIRLSGLMFMAGFILAGLDWRFSWLPLPGWVSGLGAVLLLAAYGLYAEVLRENTYLSRTVEVQENQTVIDTGLYGLVRHPMYSAATILFWSIPLVLGSVIALLVFLPWPVLLLRRIRNEEAVLEQGLPGYREYEARVRWRLLPGIY